MNDKLKNSSQRVQDILKGYNLDINVVEFPDTTRTAQEAANVIECEVAQIAKTLIFKCKDSNKPVCVIASGKNRVDEKKVKALIGEAIERPDAAFVLKHTSFVIGGVPPIGYKFDMLPLIDKDLTEFKTIWAAAGTPFSVFKVSPLDLINITQGKVCDVKKSA